MQRYSLLIMLFAWVVAGCNNNRENEAMDSLTRSLNGANEIITINNNLMYDGFDKKVKAIESRAKALLWYPQVQRVKALSTSFYNYVDSLQKQVQLNSANNRSVRSLLNKVGDSLYAKWKAYCLVIPVIDTIAVTGNPHFVRQLQKDAADMKQAFAERWKLDGDNVISFPVDAKKWKIGFFEEATPALASMVLLKLKNDALAMENVMIQYFNSNIAAGCGLYIFDSFIGVISASRVKAGQTIEIYAGKGDFSHAAQPQITIYDSTLRTTPGGTVVYSFVARGKPGKYYVPVKMSYYTPDGQRPSVTKQLEYIIAE